MKNAIKYYYDIYVDELMKKDQEIHFYFNNEEYYLLPLDRPYNDINSLYKLNVEMIKRNILVHKIVLNKDEQVVTVINEKKYILIKLCSYKNKKILLNDIKYYQNFTMYISYDNNLLRNNWNDMWCEKIDYYEYQISELGKKYPILRDSLCYYIGLGENAISYLKNNEDKINKDVINIVSHKRININKGSFSFYNPLEFIIDNRVRDISEYIKKSFFYDEFNIYEIKSYLDKSNFSESELILFYARLLFPTYYFDVYDEIINNNLPEDEILLIIKKSKDYENLLIQIYNYITNGKRIYIDGIDWLLRK